MQIWATLSSYGREITGQHTSPTHPWPRRAQQCAARGAPGCRMRERRRGPGRPSQQTAARLPPCGSRPWPGLRAEDTEERRNSGGRKHLASCMMKRGAIQSCLCTTPALCGQVQDQWMISGPTTLPYPWPTRSAAALLGLQLVQSAGRLTLVVHLPLLQAQLQVQACREGPGGMTVCRTSACGNGNQTHVMCNIPQAVRYPSGRKHCDAAPLVCAPEALSVDATMQRRSICRAPIRRLVSGNSKYISKDDQPALLHTLLAHLHHLHLSPRHGTV